MTWLEKINDSADLKHFTAEELSQLAEEIRHEIISVVSENGGHLASNLGAVELTLALHFCLNIPEDNIVWDVGHQSYIHKILTGRRERIRTIRRNKGLAGFPRRDESSADAFGTGHASTAISAALGLATARDHCKLKHKVVAVVGDGALTGGLAYEGLNNAGASKRDFIVILNDNKMSISKNVGALSRHLTGIMVDQRFNKLRNEIWELTGRFKRRDRIRAMVSHIEDAVKGFFVPGIFFDRLGFRYFGPIDGHDLPLLIKTINQMLELPGPLLLHVLTVKGKGYPPAEADATKFHGIGSFDKITGKATSAKELPSYTQICGDTLVELAESNDKIVAVTAAMTSGTGLTKFAERFPDRLYDVGIAEGHASCFAAGLAAGGMRPFIVIYSTFLQRAYDQIIHDIALQKLPVVICLDRAGLVGEDGPTHHGAFDLSYLMTVPGLTIMAPRDGDELRAMLHAASGSINGPVAIRYPRSPIPYPLKAGLEELAWGKWESFSEDGETVVIACGSMVEVALRARETVKSSIDVAVVNARFIKPLDTVMLDWCASRFKNIVTIEENSVVNGLGSAIAGYLLSKKYAGSFHMFGIPDQFVTHGDRNQLLHDIGLDEDNLADFLGTLNGLEAAGVSRLTFKKNGYRRTETVSIERRRRAVSDKE